MKIVKVDNFDRDMVPDVLIAAGIRSEQAAKVMPEALNVVFGGEDSPDYYRVVEDHYKLRSFEP